MNQWLGLAPAKTQQWLYSHTAAWRTFCRHQTCSHSHSERPAILLYCRSQAMLLHRVECSRLHRKLSDMRHLQQEGHNSIYFVRFLSVMTRLNLKIPTHPDAYSVRTPYGKTKVCKMRSSACGNFPDSNNSL